MLGERVDVVRERKDGGYSPCKASEENVGKRRCCHVPNSLTFKMHVNKISRSLEEIEVPKDFIDMPQKDKVKFATKIVENLQPMDEKQVEDVVDKLREM